MGVVATRFQTKSKHVNRSKIKSNFIQGNNQSWYSAVNKCTDCNKMLIGRGTMWVDRKAVSPEYPFGETLCKLCASKRGIQVAKYFNRTNPGNEDVQE